MIKTAKLLGILTTAVAVVLATGAPALARTEPRLDLGWRVEAFGAGYPHAERRGYREAASADVASLVESNVPNPGAAIVEACSLARTSADLLTDPYLPPKAERTIN